MTECGADYEKMDDYDEEDEVHDLQATHSTHMGNTKYGLTGQRLNQTTIKWFRSVSDKWQRWYGMVSRPPRSDFYPVRESTVEAPIDSEIQRAVEQLHGIGASFKSEGQEKSVRTIVSDVSPIVSILPTGGGKTDCILIPALIHRRKTQVVITPYIALAEDLKKRCDKLEIDCIQYVNGTARRTNIVVVVTDTATTVAFQKYIRNLELNGVMGSLFFDEAHTLLTEIGYRHKFESVRMLAFGVQMVFLTATFPPQLESRFEIEMLLTNPRPTYIRMATYRREIAYSVIVLDGELQEGVAQLIERETLGKEDKVLVFGRSVSLCKELSDKLICSVYHSTADDKKEQLQRWADGDTKVMVATTALGAGMDIDRVMVVIHADK